MNNVGKTCWKLTRDCQIISLYIRTKNPKRILDVPKTKRFKHNITYNNIKCVAYLKGERGDFETLLLPPGLYLWGLKKPQDGVA